MKFSSLCNSRKVGFPIILILILFIINAVSCYKSTTNKKIPKDSVIGDLIEEHLNKKTVTYNAHNSNNHDYIKDNNKKANTIKTLISNNSLSKDYSLRIVSDNNMNSINNDEFNPMYSNAFENQDIGLNIPNNQIINPNYNIGMNNINYMNQNDMIIYPPSPVNLANPYNLPPLNNNLFSNQNNNSTIANNNNIDYLNSALNKVEYTINQVQNAKNKAEQELVNQEKKEHLYNKKMTKLEKQIQMKEKKLEDIKLEISEEKLEGNRKTKIFKLDDKTKNMKNKKINNDKKEKITNNEEDFNINDDKLDKSNKSSNNNISGNNNNLNMKKDILLANLPFSYCLLDFLRNNKKTKIEMCRDKYYQDDITKIQSKEINSVDLKIIEKEFLSYFNNNKRISNKISLTKNSILTNTVINLKEKIMSFSKELLITSKNCVLREIIEREMVSMDNNQINKMCLIFYYQAYRKELLSNSSNSSTVNDSNTSNSGNNYTKSLLKQLTEGKKITVMYFILKQSYFKNKSSKILPFFYNKEEMEALKSSLVESKINLKKQFFKLEYDYITELFKKHVSKKVSENNNSMFQNSLFFSFDDYLLSQVYFRNLLLNYSKNNLSGNNKEDGAFVFSFPLVDLFIASNINNWNNNTGQTSNGSLNIKFNLYKDNDKSAGNNFSINFIPTKNINKNESLVLSIPKYNDYIEEFINSGKISNNIINTLTSTNTSGNLNKLVELNNVFGAIIKTKTDFSIVKTIENATTALSKLKFSTQMLKMNDESNLIFSVKDPISIVMGNKRKDISKQENNEDDIIKSLLNNEEEDDDIAISYKSDFSGYTNTSATSSTNNNNNLISDETIKYNSFYSKNLLFKLNYKITLNRILSPIRRNLLIKTPTQCSDSEVFKNTKQVEKETPEKYDSPLCLINEVNSIIQLTKIIFSHIKTYHYSLKQDLDIVKNYSSKSSIIGDVNKQNISVSTLIEKKFLISYYKICSLLITYIDERSSFNNNRLSRAGVTSKKLISFFDDYKNNTVLKQLLNNDSEIKLLYKNSSSLGKIEELPKSWDYSLISGSIGK